MLLLVAAVVSCFADDSRVNVLADRWLMTFSLRYGYFCFL